jgi:hypothetical protein
MFNKEIIVHLLGISMFDVDDVSIVGTVIVIWLL